MSKEHIKLTDRNLLRSKLVLKDMSEKDLSKAMGVDYGGLLKKLQNIRYFTAYDIYKITLILELSGEEVNDIFFSKKYSKIE